MRLKNDELLVARRACDLVDRKAPINLERLSALLTFTSTAMPSTSLFEGVIRLAPDATTTVHGDGRIDIAANAHELAECSMTAIDAADALWARVLISVRRAVQDSKRVAVLTGGGVDSSALLAAAIAVCRGAKQAEVSAIALHFGGVGDDRPYLQALERDLGIVAVRIPPSDAAHSLVPLLECPTMPVWSWSSATDEALLRAARECGADIALTGLGGDDLLDGTPRALADDFVRGRLNVLLRAARLGPSEASSVERIRDHVLRPIAGRAMPRRVRSVRRRKALLRQCIWAGPMLRSYVSAESTRWSMPVLDSPTQRFDSFAKATYLADGVELCEEVAGRAGIRIAHPYLDSSLVEFVSQLPPRLLLHANRLRGLFRLAIRGHVPTTVRLRSTKASFLDAWRETLHAAGGKKVLDDLATVDECARHGLVDPTAFRSAFENLERDDATWTLLWPVLGIEGFLRARASLRAA